MDLRLTCPACDSPGGRLRRVAFAPFVAGRCGITDTEATVCMCPNCGTVYSRSVPTEEQLRALYFGYRDFTYDRARLQWEPTYDPHEHHRAHVVAERIRRLAEWIPTGAAILDVGGDDGALMPLASRWRGVVDPSGMDTAPGVERLTGLDVAPMVDVVLCLHVLEHVREPLAMLRAMAGKLKRIGQVVIEVPMAGPVIAGKWPSRVHEHLQWFTPRGLDEMAHRAGLIVGRSETADTCLGLVRTMSLHRA